MKESLIKPEIIKGIPFLRWAGGKRWFLKYLNDLTPSKFNNYHEPFIGGAAVFLHLKPQNKSFISDLNTELIDTYISVRDEVESIIYELGNFTNTEEDYYKVRDCAFDSTYKRAARFIYLNQTSFNGIYRVNLKGVYNVPYGFRNGSFLKPENLHLVSKTLKKSEIHSCDFEIVKSRVKRNDLVFLDPPYTVSHNNNGFIKYNQKIFSLEDQYRLSSLIDYIKQKDAYYILTNAAHQIIEEIFEKGDKKIKVKRASLIGGENAVRGQFEEIVFTNIL